MKKRRTETRTEDLLYLLKLVTDPLNFYRLGDHYQVATISKNLQELVETEGDNIFEKARQEKKGARSVKRLMQITPFLFTGLFSRSEVADALVLMGELESGLSQSGLNPALKPSFTLLEREGLLKKYGTIRIAQYFGYPSDTNAELYELRKRECKNSSNPVSRISSKYETEASSTSKKTPVAVSPKNIIAEVSVLFALKDGPMKTKPLFDNALEGGFIKEDGVSDGAHKRHFREILKGMASKGMIKSPISHTWSLPR